MAIEGNVMAYLEAFLEETEEQLQALEERLVRLEKCPQDRSCLEEIFRLAHTLKGNAATVGFEGMAKLAHRMEDLLDSLRRGLARVTPEVVDALLASLDALKGMAEEAAGRGGCTADLAGLTWRLECLARQTQVAKEEKEAAATVQVRVELAEDCAMPAARAYVVLRCLAELGNVIEARPTLAEVEGLGFEGRQVEATVAVRDDPQVLSAALAATPEVKKVQVLPLGTPLEVRIEVGQTLDPQALAARLAQEGAAKVVLDLSGLSELSASGLNWLLSLQEQRYVVVIPPRLAAGRRFFELLLPGCSLSQG